MKELLTRELTNDQLSLVSGGGEADQSNSGLRDIYDYWGREWGRDFSRMEGLDNNGNGDRWDGVAYTYGAFVASTGAVAVHLALGGSTSLVVG
jgi:hypothetical protein